MHHEFFLAIVKEVLKRYGDKFKEKMDLTSNVLAELLEKGIISKADKKTIQEMADPVRQNAELLLVLKDKCSSDQDWVTVCDIIIAAKGGSAMTQLGEDMKHMLTSSKYCVLCIGPHKCQCSCIVRTLQQPVCLYVVYICACVHVRVPISHGDTDCNYHAII